MLKVGVIGLGTVSPIHLLSINNSPYADLVAVCDINSNRAKEKCEQTHCEIIPSYTDYKEMIEKEDLDVVHITLTHYLHAEVSKYALSKGLNVFCEKPVDVSYEKTKDLYDFYQAYKGKQKLGICFQNRYNKSVVKLKEILEENKEEVFAVKGLVTWYRNMDYYKQAPWRGSLKEAGAGVIINQAIHTLDLMAYVTGKDWKSLTATMSKLMIKEVEVEDTANAFIKYEDGVNGLFIATNAYSITDSIELQVISKNEKYTIKENRLFNRNLECLAEDEKSDATKDYYGAGHETLINKFYKAIIDGTDDYCDLADAMETMEIIQAIIDSSNENKEVKKEEIIND